MDTTGPGPIPRLSFLTDDSASPLPANMSLSTSVYNVFFKRNSVFASTVFAGAFFFGVGFDSLVQSTYDKWNAGKQWKDIRHKYVEEE
ncbi:ubiquinol-cytochrome C reductase [Schizophyllum commune]